MQWLQRLKDLFRGPAAPARFYPVAVRCAACGEVVQTQLHLGNDLSLEDNESSGETTYICRKVLMGKQRCYRQIEVVLRFDAHRRLLTREASGGEFVEGGNN